MKLLYFAWLREKAGTARDDAAPPADVETVRDLIDWLKREKPWAAEAFANLDAIRVAVNQEYVGWDHPVAAGDEVAFFPPVTGG
jgi:molybdopterin synthase sulfur carrier subunit